MLASSKTKNVVAREVVSYLTLWHTFSTVCFCFTWWMEWCKTACGDLKTLNFGDFVGLFPPIFFVLILLFPALFWHRHSVFLWLQVIIYVGSRQLFFLLRAHPVESFCDYVSLMWHVVSIVWTCSHNCIYQQCSFSFNFVCQELWGLS